MKETEYIENLSRRHKTNYSPWKATKAVKPPVESKKSLRTPCGSRARSAEEKATLFANHLSFKLSFKFSEVFKPNPSKNEFSSPVIHKILLYFDHVKVEFEDIKQIVKHQIKSNSKEV